MPNLGPTELIVILVIALLVFGPNRLPELGRSIGRGLREFKKARDEVTSAIKVETKDLGLDPKELGMSAKDLGLSAKDLGLSAKDLDPKTPLATSRPAAPRPASAPAAGAAGTAAAAAASALGAAAASAAAPGNGGTPATAAASGHALAAATAGAGPVGAARVDPIEASPADRLPVETAAGEADDGVPHGEVINDTPAAPSAPEPPSAAHDARSA